MHNNYTSSYKPTCENTTISRIFYYRELNWWFERGKILKKNVKGGFFNEILLG